MITRRCRMSPDARKAAILDAATRILMTQSWEAVTVADLLKAIGISKGGFYHHFSSKDDVLAAVVLRLADDSIAAGQAGLARPPADPVARFSMFLADSARWELTHAAKIAAIVHMALKAGNESLFMKLAAETKHRRLPLIRALLQEGIDRSAFQIVDVELTADLLMRVARGRWPTFLRARRIADEGDRDTGWGMIRDRVQAEESLTNRLLGLDDGAVRLAPLDEYAALLDPQRELAGLP